MNEQPSRGGRLSLLMPMLESDPDNLALLADAAETALAERQPEVAAELLGRHAAIAPLAPQQSNLAGLAALELRRFDEAAAHFDALIAAGADDPAVRFNAAWAHAMGKDFARALELLDETAAAALPQAAMLQVQLLHELGEFDAAAELGRRFVELHPDHPGLLAAVSVLALDVDDPDLAERCASGAADHPDAMTTLGTLALGQDRPDEALAMFDRALGRSEAIPRAWIGRGLARLASGDAGPAASDIERGAEMFGDHLGSWIAAGWAHFVNRDLAAARARFEQALALDDTFAESHGSLAVVDVLEGRIDEARARSEVALRLDRQCFSAALARTLLASAEGDRAAAARMFEAALHQPVDSRGRTIAQSLARLGLRGG